jgi:C1A family cysteine protease
MKHKLNWSPSKPDHRDRLFSAHNMVTKVLPKKVDISAGMSPIRDQGELGCCVGESSCASVEFLERQYGTDHEFKGSVLFAYYNARRDKRNDTGAEIRDSIKAMAKLGVAVNRLWPFNISKFAQKPPASAYKEALKQLITSYERALNLQEIKAGLASQHPVLIGFTCFESLESDETAKTGVVPYPQAHEGTIGGHAICLVGYDDTTGLLKFKNSWGKSWGDHGYGYLPYEYVTKGLADDFWVVKK